MCRKDEIIAQLKQKRIFNDGLFVWSRGNNFFGFDHDERTDHWIVTIYDCLRYPTGYTGFSDSRSMIDFLLTYY